MVKEMRSKFLRLDRQLERGVRVYLSVAAVFSLLLPSVCCTSFVQQKGWGRI